MNIIIWNCSISILSLFKNILRFLKALKQFFLDVLEPFKNIDMIWNSTNEQLRTVQELCLMFFKLFKNHIRTFCSYC